MYDNSSQVFDYARKLVKSHGLLRDNVLRTTQPEMSTLIDNLSIKVAYLLSLSDQPFENKDVITALPSVKRYASDLTSRLRIDYKHGLLDYKVQLRIPESVADLLEAGDSTHVDVTNCFMEFLLFWQELNQTFGFSDFSIQGTELARIKGTFNPINYAPAIVGGTKNPLDYSAVERSVGFRLEGTSVQVVQGVSQSLKTSLTFSGYEVATFTPNPSLNDFRLNASEYPDLITALSVMDGQYLGVTGMPVTWKKYVNVLNRSVQRRLR